MIVLYCNYAPLPVFVKFDCANISQSVIFQNKVKWNLAIYFFTIITYSQRKMTCIAFTSNTNLIEILGDGTMSTMENACKESTLYK